MKGKYDTVQFAEYIIQLCNESCQYVSNLQLQKILYYVQGEFMKCFGYKAFEDPIECWPYGPVVKKVWKIYSAYGRKPINCHNSTIQLNEKELLCTKRIINAKLRMNVWDLVDETHKELPWRKANEENKTYICDKDMEAFFCQ